MTMNRIKVINEPSELVPMLRSVDTPVKRDVLKEVTLEWRTADEIEQKALDCCGSIVQGWWANYNKWGRQKWYGR